MIETMTIFKSQTDYLKEKIEKLNRRARKLNCPEMTLTFGEESTREWRNDFGRKMIDRYIEATLEYELPIIDGWKLISTFDIYTAPSDETDDEGAPKYENVVTTSTVPGETLPVEYADKAEIHCDHCGHNRYRTHSMLMQNVETGEYKEVGSTCVKDFFGHDPLPFMRWASWSFAGIIGELPEEEAGFGARGRSYIDMRDLLIVASATIRKFGWMSKGRAYREGLDWSTSDEVLIQLNPPNSMREEDRVEPDNKDIELAEGAIAHFKAIEQPVGDDYLNNIWKLIKMGFVPFKHVGIATSIIPCYKRILGEVKAAAEDTSEYQGEIGDRLKKIECETIFTKEFQTDFGVSCLCIFKDAAGNVYKTFYSGNSWETFSGDLVELTGTVKKHEEYKGRKATMLNRCIVKVTKEAEEETEAAA